MTNALWLMERWTEEEEEEKKGQNFQVILHSSSFLTLMEAKIKDLDR